MKISAHADHNPDHYRFLRQHTGEIEPGPRLQPPLWPWLLGAIVLLLIGCRVILVSTDSVIALGGLGICFVGLAAFGAFCWLLGKEID